MLKKKVVAPLIIFILLVVAAITISNGYFGLQGQSNRLDADPSTAADMNDLPGVPSVSVKVKTDKAETDTTVGKE